MDSKRLLRFIRLIESVSLEYMITDSIAAILYGKPRLTQDMDVVVVLPLKENEFYCPPPESIREEIRQGAKGHFNIIDQATGFKIDVYSPGQEDLILWGLKNKKRLEIIAGEEVWVAPPEYVIVKKLVYFQEGGSQKHLEDIRGMLDVSGEDIDQTAVGTWVAKLGLKSDWKMEG